MTKETDGNIEWKVTRIPTVYDETRTPFYELRSYRSTKASRPRYARNGNKGYSPRGYEKDPEDAQAMEARLQTVQQLKDALEGLPDLPMSRQNLLKVTGLEIRQKHWGPYELDLLVDPRINLLESLTEEQKRLLAGRGLNPNEHEMYYLWHAEPPQTNGHI